MNPAENYILNQSEPWRSILLHLQVVIESTVHKIELKYKYKIPFYYLKGKPFCYLNVTNGYVDVGFWKGSQLILHKNNLVTGKRKIIRFLRYKKLTEINDKILVEVLREAEKLY